MMQLNNRIFTFLYIFVFITSILGCKKTTINPEYTFSYKINYKTYNHEYFTSPGLFGGYQSIEARQISGGFVIATNYTHTSHNTVEMYFVNRDFDLPLNHYGSDDPNFSCTLDNYKGPNGGYYVLDRSFKAGYIKFSHVSEEYVEGTFHLRFIAADKSNPLITNPEKKTTLKNGKFRIAVH